MIRPAAPADLPAIDAFLSARAGTSMFLRSNIAAHGVAGGDHPHATAVSLAPAAGALRAVFGRTAGGMLMVQAPDDAGETDAWAAHLDGQAVAGMTGEPGQVGRLMQALRLDPGRVQADHVEPLLELALDAPGQAGVPLRPAREADIPLLTGWFRDYLRETGVGPPDPDAAGRLARGRAQMAVGGPVRILEVKGQPVAMAALNARAGVDVQVGGVFVPPTLRNRGLGRAVTAGLLAEARAAGAARAFLFSNNDAATRAYRALGFTQVGEFRIVLLHTS